jgi:hypothetical protein
MKPSRSLRPNHSWLRNFFVVMGNELRAGSGAKYSVERVAAQRAMLLRTENVYSGASDARPCSAQAEVLGRDCSPTLVRRSAMFRSPSRETKLCDDIAK